MMMMMVFGIHARAHTGPHIGTLLGPLAMQRTQYDMVSGGSRTCNVCSNICRSSQHSVREFIGRQFSLPKIFHRVQHFRVKDATRLTEEYTALHSVLTQTLTFNCCYRIVVVVLHFIQCAMFRSKCKRMGKSKKI